jgi:hypothetical protein
MRFTKLISVLARQKGLAAGLVLGFLIGSAGLVFSSMTLEGWGKQPTAFKLGYIAGYTDVVRMVKRSTPGHQVAQAYRIPSGAKPINWLYHIETIIKEGKKKPKDITQAIAFAGDAMGNDYGDDVVVSSGLEQMAAVMARRRAAIAAGDIEETPPDVTARRRYIAARERARTNCLRPCRQDCKSTCRAKIRAKYPSPPELEPKEETPVPDKEAAAQ